MCGAKRGKDINNISMPFPSLFSETDDRRSQFIVYYTKKIIPSGNETPTIVSWLAAPPCYQLLSTHGREEGQSWDLKRVAAAGLNTPFPSRDEGALSPKKGPGCHRGDPSRTSVTPTPTQQLAGVITSRGVGWNSGDIRQREGSGVGQGRGDKKSGLLL